MSYTIIKKLPSVDEMIESIPLTDEGYQKIKKDRAEVNNILEGKDKRLLMIIGPCSAWPKEAVLEYAAKLYDLTSQVGNELKLIMRVYIQKPRTAKGWTGPVNQPDPFAFPDIETGARYAREMMVKVIEMGLPIADEALFTHNARGFLELLSWVAIGARSTEDQEHRIFASAINCAVGMKNPTHGSIAIGINSIIAAQHPHVAVFEGYEVQTHGNAHAHLVLRGSNNEPNYSLAYLEETQRLMDLHRISNPSVIIDASHDNCVRNGKKNHALQPDVIFEVLESVRDNKSLKKLVKGFMVESFLQEGNQKVDANNPQEIDLSGLSITDPCLGWEKTKDMLLHLASIIRENNK